MIQTHNMIALVIGRFQPFHNGHLQLITQLSKEYKTIIIGIGSAQYSHTTENPFSFEERSQMITNTLHHNKITNFTIVAIPDLHNPPNWVKHVISLTPSFDVVITNNEFTEQLFKEKKYTVKQTPLYKRDKYSGKEIRRRIQEKTTWKQLVPPEIYKYIQRIDGETRIRQ
jgi:nicotinamide-nucleotide adenylyltransferase